eukprot:478345-Pleurochrysis_carterae.AAC.1
MGKSSVKCCSTAGQWARARENPRGALVAPGSCMMCCVRRTMAIVSRTTLHISDRRGQPMIGCCVWRAGDSERRRLSSK